MTTSQYAQRTTVDSSSSRLEIERTLVRYGATSFAYGWQDTAAMIGFVVNDRHVRFVLPMPDPGSSDFTRTPTGLARSGKAALASYQQAVRARWRALLLVIKAKFEAVAAGVVSFEQEFYAQTVLPDGRTVYQATVAAVEQAQLTGVTPPMFQIEAR